MKVLHVSRPATGGLRQHLLTLIDLQSQSGVEALLAAPADLCDAISHRSASLQCFEINISDRPSLTRDFHQALRIASLIRRIRPGLVHAHGIRASWISGLAPVRLPRVSTVHNLLSASASRINRMAALTGLKRADAVIAVSEAVRQTLICAGLPGPKTTVIPNGIAFPGPGASRPAGVVRESLGLPPGGPLVLCVARLMPDKGVDILIRGWPAVQAVWPQAVCLIAGDGPDRNALENIAAGSGSVVFGGQVSDVASLYGAADVLVIPSRREGQSIVCLEGMASDPAPVVVASAAGGLPEMVLDGETGFLAPVEEPQALARAILRALAPETGRESITRQARVMVQERYTASAMAARTAKIYAAVVEKRRPRA